MRDGNTAGLSQRVGVGIWLALGATLALLAVQTVLVTSESTIVTDLGAPTASESAAAAAPVLPAATPNLLMCSGSDCPSAPATGGATTGSGTVTTSPTGGSGSGTSSTVIVASPPVPVVTDGSSAECLTGSAGAVSTPSGIEFSDVDPCEGLAGQVQLACDFVRADLGYSSTERLISTAEATAVGSTVDGVDLAIVTSNNGSVFEQYDCDGAIVTIKRDVYGD